MKIKNLIIFYPSFERGGVEMIIKNLISFLTKKKLNIYLITSNSHNLKTIKKAKNLKIIKPQVNNFDFLPNRFSTSINCGKLLINLTKKLDKSNTVIHSMQSNFVPIVIAKYLNFKIVMRNSEDPIESIKYSENKISSYLIFLLRFIFYNLADKIITNSKGSSRSLKFFLFGKNKNKIQYIYNPYITKIYRNKFKKKKKIILAVGRLCKQKNFEDLIISFNDFQKKHRNYILNIIGDGYQREMLKKLIISLKLEKKIFLKGYIKNLRNEYKKAMLFVLPSIYEGLGNVLLDALNYSVPCISTRCKSGPKEILCYGKGGTLVPIKNTELLTKAIIDSIDNYKISIRKMMFAKKKISRFLVFSQSEKYLKELNKILL